MLSRLMILLLAAVLVGCTSDSDSEMSQSNPPDSVRQRVEAAIHDLNAMRESLAKKMDASAVDRETFARVCKPVGKRAKSIAQSHGWAVQQLARKYRNPAHQLDAEADSIYAQFVHNPEQTKAWLRTVRNGTEGWRYFRRITVEPACLACHGAKADRPSFVKEGYPKDRAYGFEEGDLRGLYAVFVPDSTVALTPQ